METQRLTKKDSAQIVEILNRGGVVAFPTDTVYGLAVRYDLKEAILKMKGSETKTGNQAVSNDGFVESPDRTGCRYRRAVAEIDRPVDAWSFDAGV